MEGKSIPASSIQNPDHSGWMTKQGNSYKSWKKRWFILKGDKLYYFKSPKDLDLTGVVQLNRNSQVRREPKKKSKYCLAINASSGRTFFTFPDKESEIDIWIHQINKQIELVREGAGLRAGTRTTPNGFEEKDWEQKEGKSDEEEPLEGIRLTLQNAKEVIPFLQEYESKTSEFWTLWADSIPSVSEDIEKEIGFEISTSADMEKVSWRSSGPQNIFIQNMVDFFWGVGAPEAEIDHLNDIGVDINPALIGSWIDMSSSNGMDGGWYFPVQVSVDQIISASDPGNVVKVFQEWAKSHGIERAFYIGRDMGAAPPRQTETKFLLPGKTYHEQLEVGLSIYDTLGVPEIPKDALNMISNGKSNSGLAMSVVTSNEGIVRLGMLFPVPSKQAVAALCHFSGVSSPDDIHRFENSLGVPGPSWVELQYLMRGFGYGVYKEGFDVIFHYRVRIHSFTYHVFENTRCLKVFVLIF